MPSPAKPHCQPRPLAPHVQAAVQRSAAQAFAAGPAGRREPAAHLRQALAASLQKKAAAVRQPAPHLEKALAAGRRPPALAQAMPAARANPRPAVQASLATFEPVDPKAEELVGKVRKKVPEAGNLGNSSLEARQRFERAEKLFELLTARQTIEDTAMEALIREALYLEPHQTVSGYAGWGKFQADQVRDFKKDSKNTRKRDELLELATAVYRDFVLKKTGGGSCDHISASTFLKLAKKFPESKIILVRYAPQSDKKYRIEAPESLPYHRSVLWQNEGKILDVDAWWPGGKVEQIDDFGKYDPVVPWNNDHKDFVKHLRTALELQFQEVKSDLPEAGCFGGDIKARWQIERNE